MIKFHTSELHSYTLVVKECSVLRVIVLVIFTDTLKV